MSNVRSRLFEGSRPPCPLWSLERMPKPESGSEQAIIHRRGFCRGWPLHRNPAHCHHGGDLGSQEERQARNQAEPLAGGAASSSPARGRCAESARRWPGSIWWSGYGIVVISSPMPRPARAPPARGVPDFPASNPRASGRSNCSIESVGGGCSSVRATVAFPAMSRIGLVGSCPDPKQVHGLCRTTCLRYVGIAPQATGTPDVRQARMDGKEPSRPVGT